MMRPIASIRWKWASSNLLRGSTTLNLRSLVSLSDSTKRIHKSYSTRIEGWHDRS